MKLYLTWLATLTSLCAFVLQSLGIWGELNKTSALFGVAIVAFLLTIGFDSSTRRLRFLVKRGCKAIKKHASATLDIAAGDCSWLPDEVELLTERSTSGVAIRLLCERTQNPSWTEAIARVASLPTAEVRTYSHDFGTDLRCVLADAARPPNRALILLDKTITARTFFGFVSCPEFLRRNLSATFVPPQSRLFGLTCVAFDSAFRDGALWQSPQSKENAHRAQEKGGSA